MANCLSPSPQIPDGHELERLPDIGKKQSHRKRCKICSLQDPPSDKKTSWYCETCQAPMCKCCWRSSVHVSFATSPEGQMCHYKAKFVTLSRK